MEELRPITDLDDQYRIQ